MASHSKKHVVWSVHREEVRRRFKHSLFEMVVMDILPSEEVQSKVGDKLLLANNENIILVTHSKFTV
jgi:hypothetical protein